MEKFHSDIAFLLVSTKEGVAGDRMYGLSMVWVNPYQARVPTVEEVVKQLTTLVSSGPDWPYTLVWLNGNTCHGPLPREGHLSILPEGSTSSATCGRVSQLEIHQLLSWGLQVIYLVGLNGCKIPLITSLPRSLANGANLPGGKPIYLEVDIPQSIAEGPEWNALPLVTALHPDGQPHQGYSAKGRKRGQHDHGSEGVPVLGGIRHFWTHIRELDPKKTKSHGCTHTPAPQIGRSFWAS